MNLIKPPLLKEGDTIGVLAVSGAIDDNTNLNRAIDFFKKRGFNVKLSENINSKYRYLAGNDDERVQALHNMFSDKSINAIIALRGGYGAIRILDKIDYNIVRENPKIFCGYSDITALNVMFLKRAGLVTYSGPMVMSDFGIENPNVYTIEKFFDAVMKNKFDYEGNFWGGNLSTLVSLCGQDFIPDFKFDFFVEDLNEPVYKIDKMLTQLINIQKFAQNIKSIYMGDFLDTDNQQWLEELFAEVSNKLNVHLYKNFPASHSEKKATIMYS